MAQICAAPSNLLLAIRLANVTLSDDKQQMGILLQSLRERLMPVVTMCSGSLSREASLLVFSTTTVMAQSDATFDCGDALPMHSVESSLSSVSAKEGVETWQILLRKGLHH